MRRRAGGSGAVLRAALAGHYREIIDHYGPDSDLMQSSPWPRMLDRLRAGESVRLQGWAVAPFVPVPVEDHYVMFELGADDTLVEVVR